MYLRGVFIEERVLYSPMGFATKLTSTAYRDHGITVRPQYQEDNSDRFYFECGKGQVVISVINNGIHAVNITAKYQEVL